MDRLLLAVSWHVSPVSHSMLQLCLVGGITMEILLGNQTWLLRNICGLAWSRRNSHLEDKQAYLDWVIENKSENLKNSIISFNRNFNINVSNSFFEINGFT